jgi:hypothetical protein
MDIITSGHDMICAQAQLVLTPNSMPPGDRLTSRDASRLPRCRWHPIGFPRPNSKASLTEFLSFMGIKYVDVAPYYEER